MQVMTQDLSKSNIVLNLFNNIAPVYDLLNNVMSLGLHKTWKLEAVKQLNLKDGDSVLDLCCGSGDISSLIMNEIQADVDITAVDFSPDMLKIARKRLAEHDKISFIQADVLKLPFADASFSHAIISFGLRNLEDIDIGIQEINRVLKTPGFFVNIDFGKPVIPLTKILFWFYFKFVVPFYGWMLGRKQEYTYLLDSIQEFPSPDNLMKLYRQNGFLECIKLERFWGFVSIQAARK